MPLGQTHMFLTAKQARAMCRHGLTEVPDKDVINDATLLYDFISTTIMPIMSVVVSALPDCIWRCLHL